MFPDKLSRFTVERHRNHACVFGIGAGYKYRVTPDDRRSCAGTWKIDAPTNILRLTPLNG